ncbi:hypothetical protein CN311_01770 [Mesorhizobium sanjuanii]|uniref:DUF2950 domain-containing protein n=1 Tax=Mesorhizobium sanjuanii TaxID=2037900 RepID=A0A2A6FM33_9HYPH|nr:hypothetical protein CN311_01770 [Mesorhizobium sanjuanii]
MFGTTRFTGLHHRVCAAAIAFGLALSLSPVASAQDVAAPDAATPEIASLAAATEPPLFDTPEAALDAFKQALQAEGSDAVAALLGLDAAKLKADENTDDTLAAIKEGAAKQLVLDGEGDRRTVQIGEKLWPLPFPIVKGKDGKWAFDTYAGLEEIVNRRVGENELTAIETMRAYVDAQEDYASRDRDADGVAEFAQKLISSEGTADGIYWPTDAVNGESPAGDLSLSELDDAAKGEGYFGYKYKILTGQGDRIAGGAYDYLINGNMIAGFGLIAWPAKYGETGVKTFAVNQHGVVYETDLGPTTGQIVKYIDRFNPDETWEVVAD